MGFSVVFSTTTYTYGAMGELKEVVTPNQTITYKHNANNQRVAKLIDNQIVEKYLWLNLTTLLAVYDKDDNLIQRYEYADQRMPISMTTVDNSKYYLHYDQVGSLRAISRVLSPDNTILEVVKEVTYDTFGNVLADTNPSFKVPFGFAGGLYDQETKLTRFGYRDYDAYTGKWTAKDPIGFDGGDANLYGYVLGDPVGFVDSDGLSANDVKQINEVIKFFINDLNNAGLRRLGSGTLNGWLNNFRSWDQGYLGCIDQTDLLLDRLKGLELDDTWSFYHSRPNPLHSNIKAVSSNKNDPKLYLDPWLDSIEEF